MAGLGVVIIAWLVICCVAWSIKCDRAVEEYSKGLYELSNSR
jgi:hypothetical protein